MRSLGEAGGRNAIKKPLGQGASVISYGNFTFERTVPDKISALTCNTVIRSWIAFSPFAAIEHAFVLLWRSSNCLTFTWFGKRGWVRAYFPGAHWSLRPLWIITLRLRILTDNS